MSDFRKMVDAIAEGAGGITRLQSVGRWSQWDGGETLPPAFTAHLTLDGAEYMVSLIPTRGAPPATTEISTREYAPGPVPGTLVEKGHAPETS